MVKSYIKSEFGMLKNFYKLQEFCLPDCLPASLTTTTNLPPNPLGLLPLFFLNAK